MKKPAIIISIIVAIVVVISVIFAITWFEINDVFTWSWKPSKSDLINLCRDQVKDYLKAPSTAIFTKEEIKNIEMWNWPVIYWMVESQNTYWWMVKDYFYCYWYDRNIAWKFEDVLFSNNEKDEQFFRLISHDFATAEEY